MIKSIVLPTGLLSASVTPMAADLAATPPDGKETARQFLGDVESIKTIQPTGKPGTPWIPS